MVGHTPLRGFDDLDLFGGEVVEGVDEAGNSLFGVLMHSPPLSIFGVGQPIDRVVNNVLLDTKQIRFVSNHVLIVVAMPNGFTDIEAHFMSRVGDGGLVGANDSAK